MTVVTETTITRRPVGDLRNIRAFLERHRDIRERSPVRLAAVVSDKAVAAEYFTRFFDICEELLMRVEYHDRVLQEIAWRLEPHPRIETSRRDLQAAILVRLANALASIPDGTYVAISYEGKILAQSRSQGELARMISMLGVPLSQIFIYLKGQTATFGER
jgi:hypothetical protein